MRQENHNAPGVWKHLLIAAGLGVAILIGFVMGLQFGDRVRHQPDRLEVPDIQLLADTILGSEASVYTDTEKLVLAPDSLVAPADTLTNDSGPSRKEIVQGVEYLAAHNRWNRDEMEQIPALHGLWDAVNTYSLDKIRAYNEILGSTPLTTIVEGLEKKPKQGFYAAKNDHDITLSTYVKLLR